MNGSLDRGKILELFDELSKELQFSRTRAQIYIIGGAAMSLAFSRDRRTEDVDARIDNGHYRLTAAVRTVGRRHGLPDTWVNDEATTAIPRAADARATVVYESPYLTVTGASARHLFGLFAGGGEILRLARPRRGPPAQDARTFWPCSRNWPCGPTYR